MDWLWKTAGFGSPVAKDKQQAMFDRLVSTAYELRLAGVVYAPSDFQLLDEMSRAAVVHAGALFEKWRAAQAGIAAQGPESAARIAAPTDGGAALAEIAAACAAEDAALRLGAGALERTRGP